MLRYRNFVIDGLKVKVIPPPNMLRSRSELADNVVYVRVCLENLYRWDRKNESCSSISSARLTLSNVFVRIADVILMIDHRVQRLVYLVRRKVVMRSFHVPRTAFRWYYLPVEDSITDTSEHVTIRLAWKQKIYSRSDVRRGSRWNSPKKLPL